MSDPLNTIPLGERHRIVIEHDEMGREECPVEWQGTADAGILTIRKPRSYIGLSLGDDADDAAYRISLADEYGTDDEPMDAAVRMLQRRGFDVEYRSLHGYSQSDWMDVIIWARPDVEDNRVVTPGVSEHRWVDALADTVQSWFAGDIYVVAIHEAVDYVRADRVGPNSGDDPDLTLWEEVGAIGGCYIDDIYDEDEVTSLARDIEGYPEEVNA